MDNTNNIQRFKKKKKTTNDQIHFVREALGN